MSYEDPPQGWYDDPIPCPQCDAEGAQYYILDDDAPTGYRQITREEYDVTPPHLREKRRCPLCDGFGYVNDR